MNYLEAELKTIRSDTEWMWKPLRKVRISGQSVCISIIAVCGAMAFAAMAYIAIDSMPTAKMYAQPQVFEHQLSTEQTAELLYNTTLGKPKDDPKWVKRGQMIFVPDQQSSEGGEF